MHRTRRLVVPQRRRHEAVKAVGRGAIDDQPGEQRPDADPLHVVGHLDRQVGDLGRVGAGDVSTDADDRPVTRVDHGEGFVPDVINLRHECELARGEHWLRPVKPPVP